MPTFRHLRSVIVIAETGSATKAARLLGTVPSALTADVAALEAEYGCRLFERDGRGMHPTEKGRELSRRAEQVLASLRALERGIKVPTSAIRGRVRLGLLASLAPSIAPPTVAEVAARFPDVGLTLVGAQSGDLADGLASGTLDLASLYRDEILPIHAAGPFWRDDLVLVGSQTLVADHAVTIEAALALPLALPSPRHGLRRLVERAAAARSLSVAPRVEVDAPTALPALLATGEVAAIVAASRRQALDAHLVQAPIAGLAREVTIARLRGTRLPAVLAVEEIVRRVADELFAGGAAHAVAQCPGP